MTRRISLTHKYDVLMRNCCRSTPAQHTKYELSLLTATNKSELRASPNKIQL